MFRILKKVKDFYGKLGFEEVWSYPPKNQSGYLVMKRDRSILAFFCGNEEVYNHSFFKRFPKTTRRGYEVEVCLYISDMSIDKYWRIVDPFGYYICVREKGNILEK